MSEALLEVRNLSAGYGQASVLHSVNLHVDAGEIVVILGANGAGKTTLLRALSGVIPASGEIKLGGRVVTGSPTERFVKLGVAHVPEGRGTFGPLSVEDNLQLGAYLRSSKKAISDDTQFIFDLFPVLYDRRTSKAGMLSGGEQQMLAIGRALMSDPRILLLDEPSLGLAPQIVQKVFDTVELVNREREVTIVVVEQNAALALRSASRAYLIETGRIEKSMLADELMSNDALRRAYLGY